MTSTNCGLCQGNMTWCQMVRGNDYHWGKELYQRLKLPVVEPVVHALRKAVDERAACLEKQKLDESKRKRIQFKVAGSERERKRWVKRQAVMHTYDDDGNDELDDPELVAAADGILGDLEGNQHMTAVSGRKCRCGSFSHQRTSHRDCPLNKKRPAKYNILPEHAA